MSKTEWRLAILAFLIIFITILSATSQGATTPGEKPIRTKIGLWYTVWWTKDDFYHHWSNCHILPAIGRYSAGDPAVIAEHYARFRDMGIDFLIMDDTNGVGNDGGRINDNIGAWFDFMDAKPPSERIPICIGGGGEMRAEGASGQRLAAEYYWAHWANRPSYFKLNGKPLLLIDTDKNYGPGDFDDPRFSVRWAYNGDNHQAMKARETWGWGSYWPSPLLKESVSIWPGHRFPKNEEREGFDSLEEPREGGRLYARSLSRALEANPGYVTIADWNNFEEETAIERSWTWEDPRGYASPDLYERITRAYSRLRSEELVKGEYYRREGDRTAYLFDGARLQPQKAEPKRGIVLDVPKDRFQRIRKRFESAASAK